MTETARDLYTAGKLAEAIEAATAEVRSRPTDHSARGFLAELLCLSGDIERAGGVSREFHRPPDASMNSGFECQLHQALPRLQLPS